MTKFCQSAWELPTFAAEGDVQGNDGETAKPRRGMGERNLGGLRCASRRPKGKVSRGMIRAHLFPHHNFVCVSNWQSNLRVQKGGKI
jgi:hypothetical protein